jgi:hypothetical protein
MEPTTLVLVGAIGALSSAVSAIAAFLKRKQTGQLELKIGDKRIRLSPEDRPQIEAAIETLQSALHSGDSRGKAI